HAGHLLGGQCDRDRRAGGPAGQGPGLCRADGLRHASATAAVSHRGTLDTPLCVPVVELARTHIPGETSMTFALRAWVLCCLLLSVTACGKQSDTVVASAPHPRNPDILYVATNESLYKTRDGGATWSKMTTDLSSFRILTLGVDPHSPANDLA